MIVKTDDLNQELSNWYKNSRVKGLNIVTVPYRGLDLLEPLLEQLDKNVRVLYVTSLDEGGRLIKEYFNEKSESLKIVDFNGALKSEDEFELVIYDDVNSFPTHTRAEMHTLLTYLYKKTEKIIAYSTERVFKNVISLEHPVKADGGFIPEPRFLECRIDIKKSIPNSLFDYLNFFHQENRKVIFVVPDSTTKTGIIKYLLRVNPKYEEIILDEDGNSISEVVLVCNDKTKPTFLFVKESGDFMDIESNVDFIYINADSPKFEYRQFVFSALRSCLFGMPTGEVLMVAVQNTQNMEKAKELTKEYNKAHWENDDLFI